MAQVRIDEVILNDVRFKALANHLDLDEGIGEDLAIATCTRAFWLAQKYWRNERQLIPPKIWDMSPKLHVLLQFDLAECRNGGVYVRGAKEYFDWYHDKAEAGRLGGKKSGESRRSKTKSKQAKQKREASEAEGRRNEPVSVSVSVSDSVSESICNPPPPPYPFDRALAEEWSRFAREHSKTVKPEVGKWANTVRLLREKDGVTEEQLTSMLAFVQEDDFWKHNAISLEGLRSKSKNGLRKFENILAAMTRGPNGKPAKPKITMLEEGFDVW